jgi:hypothetical protein
MDNASYGEMRRNDLAANYRQYTDGELLAAFDALAADKQEFATEYIDDIDLPLEAVQAEMDRRRSVWRS